MPPYSSPFSAAAHNNGDLSRSYTTAARAASSLGFTSNLMETIAVSKSKMEEWARHEKAKADAVAEAYRQRLMQEQAVIDAKSTELLAVQMERGMKLETADDEASQNTADNIASRKQALEEETSAVQMEIMKLKTEKENRQERVKSKNFLLEVEAISIRLGSLVLFFFPVHTSHCNGGKEAAYACQ